MTKELFIQQVEKLGFKLVKNFATYSVYKIETIDWLYVRVYNKHYQIHTFADVDHYEVLFKHFIKTPLTLTLKQLLEK